jgi:hypothetical protein
MKKIPRDPSPVDMTPKETTKLCSLSLAGVWELSILENKTFHKDSNLFPESIYALDSARRFGFYHRDVPPHLRVDIFKKCVDIYRKYPSLRFISNLFASINDKFSNSSRKSLFEIVFCHILDVRLSSVSIWES